MSIREQYPPGVPCWIDTAQPDPRAALDFYRALLGWEFVGPARMPGEPPGDYYVARVRDRDVAGISSHPPGAPTPPAWMTYVAVGSAAAAADLARNAGGSVELEPVDAPPAGRLAVLRDPAGALFGVWEAGQRQGAQLVNEPAAWAMSLLNTSDPDRAKAFYRALFGWETEPFGPDIALFRLSGYVGGEPEQPVPRDVVAAMSAADGHESRWGVDLWVDDVEASAATAVEHGGSVPVAPREIPGFRNAVIADPQGATVSLSQLL